MAKCNQLSFRLPGLNGRRIEGNFQGGNVSSDGGLMLLREVDRRLGLPKALAKLLPDQRDPDRIEHSLESMLRQRIYGLGDFGLVGQGAAPRLARSKDHAAG